MIETKFTKGHWFVDGDDAHGQAIVRSEHLEIATFWHHSVGSIEKEMRHNANLAAAAPELYEALEEAANSSGFQYMFSETRDKINAALAKARGETQA